MSDFRVAMLLSCGSFEGFFGGVQKQTRDSFLKSYRNDWAWYYGAGLRDNGISPALYIPSLYEEGRYETDTGIAARFLPLARWYRPFEIKPVVQAFRQSNLTLYGLDRLNAIAFMQPLKHALKEDGINLLYIQEYWSGRFDHLVHRLDLPVVAMDHGGLAQFTLKWFKRRAFAKAARLYSQTPQECEIVARYGGKPELQPNGCDISGFPTEIARAHRGKTIVTIARLTNKQKRTTDLIRALALLPIDWTLNILGTGPDKPLMERVARDVGVADRVNFLGFVSRATVSDELQRCGVYAMPSQNEAVALAALEAMGAGNAVVLSNIRAFRALVQDGVNGRLVEVGDVSGLAAAILDAWENGDRLGQAAAETVRQLFDAKKLYHQLAESLRGASAAMAPAIHQACALA